MHAMRFTGAPRRTGTIRRSRRSRLEKPLYERLQDQGRKVGDGIRRVEPDFSSRFALVKHVQKQTCTHSFHHGHFLFEGP